MVNKIMKLLAAALPAVLLLAAAPAHADTTDERAFVHDIRATGWIAQGKGDAEIIAAGWRTCAGLADWPTDELVNQMALNGFPRAVAQTVVNLSVKDLCPGLGW